MRKGTSEKLSNYCNVHISAANASQLLAVSSSDTSSSLVQRFRSKCEHIVTSHSFSEVPKFLLFAGSIMVFFGSFIQTTSAEELIENIPATPDAIFTDVDQNHPYYEAINYLKEHFIVQGYEDGSFKPDQKINRAEALKIILLSANYHLDNDIATQIIETSGATEESSINYPDVPNTAWHYIYIKKATEIGIVSGYPDGFFRPEKTINLAESLKMIINANSIIPRTDFEGDPYLDVPKDSWFGHFAQFFKDYYILTEEESGYIYPDTEITRGKLSYLIYGFIKREEFQKKGKEASDKKQFIYGNATFYGGGDGFNGRGTASGEIFDDSEFTAAHLSLPFDTWIRVYATDDPENKCVEVRINDRGPYDDRFILDLSASAFETLAPISHGIIAIKYEIFEAGDINPQCAPNNLLR